jgi:serine/threonine-protein kinase HipA
MTTSEPQAAFVWVWLPDAIAPVVAGRLTREGRRFVFNYGRSYLSRPGAIALFDPELPLIAGPLPPPAPLTLAGCLRDAAPDAWGRRVILNRVLGVRGPRAETDRLDELTYLMESGSDRIGALDFQASATEYVPRQMQPASLEQLMSAADRVEAGEPLPPQLDQALFHGSSIGGARPKALLEDGARQLIAKFSSQSDIYSVVKAEFVAMRLAAAVGLDVAHVQLARAAGRDVLLVERFDRVARPGGAARRAMVSALTLLELDELMARYASYEDLTHLIRHRFVDPERDLRELFARMVFNILCGNTDDHARNHAAFWDGRQLRLTPAYDICPQPRAGREASQAMLIAGQDRRSRLTTCLAAAPLFRLSRAEALALVEAQVEAIEAAWPQIAEIGGLTPADRDLLWRRALLNPFAFEGLEGALARLAD